MITATPRARPDLSGPSARPEGRRPCPGLLRGVRLCPSVLKHVLSLPSHPACSRLQRRWDGSSVCVTGTASLGCRGKARLRGLEQGCRVLLQTVSRTSTRVPRAHTGVASVPAEPRDLRP